jgi:hypothetical protein
MHKTLSQGLPTLDEDGYPNYRRPDDRRAYEVGGHFIDNRWIVPCNPYLSAVRLLSAQHRFDQSNIHSNTSIKVEIVPRQRSTQMKR